MLWQVETELGRNIEHVMYGPLVDNQPSAWVISWDERRSICEVRNAPEGTPLFRAESESRVISIEGNRENLAFGFEDGSLYLIQSDLMMMIVLICNTHLVVQARQEKNGHGVDG